MKKPYDNTENPSVIIEEPSPGSFVISGHNPQNTLNESGEHVIPIRECYVDSSVPTSALLHVLAEREIEADVEQEKPRRGRPPKAKAEDATAEKPTDGAESSEKWEEPK